MKENSSTMITGLWLHRNEKGEEILIGRIGHNLNAVITKNPNKTGKQPDYYLHFFNGSVKDALNASSTRETES
jgi:hypothetical protein